MKLIRADQIEIKIKTYGTVVGPPAYAVIDVSDMSEEQIEKMIEDWENRDE